MAEQKHNSSPWVLIVIALITATGVVLAAMLARPTPPQSTPMPPQPTVIDLSGIWLYDIGDITGNVIIKQHEDQLEMSVIWPLYDNASRPGYSIIATLSGHNIDGNWTYIRAEDTSNTKRSGEYHAVVRNDENHIDIDNLRTEDSGYPKHNFGSTFLYRK